MTLSCEQFSAETTKAISV